jgi:hypothetical protein
VKVKTIYDCLWVAVAGCVLASVAAAQEGRQKLLPAQCDRVCLIGLVDQYLEALVAHDPSRLPLAPNVKFTENGQVMKVGDGMWGTATKIGKYKHYVADPQGGAVGFIGTVDESDQYAILGLRMKIANRQVVEIETLASRKDGPGDGDKLNEQTLPAIWSETVPPEQRVSRQKMVEIANSYFEKIERGNGNHPTPFDPSCNRIENGTQTTNNEKERPSFAGGCEEQIATGYYVFDTELRDRRFEVIDEEKGVVFAHVFFDHAGNVRTWKNLKTGEVKPLGKGLLRPSAWEIHELFKIKNGRIYQIEAVLVDVPYKMRSNWERK